MTRLIEKLQNLGLKVHIFEPGTRLQYYYRAEIFIPKDYIKIPYIGRGLTAKQALFEVVSILPKKYKDLL